MSMGWEDGVKSMLWRWEDMDCVDCIRPHAIAFIIVPKKKSKRHAAE